MEPIILVVLLFGAFTLGAELGDTPEAKTPEPITEQQLEKTERRALQLNLEACHSKRPLVIYRDLTIPVHSKPTRMRSSSDRPVSENADD